MPRFSYGGQALIEGVLMRGRDAIAVALRHPDGRIVYATERLDSGFHGSRWSKMPFLRGLVVLYETLVVGTRWLIRSANVAAEFEDEEPDPKKAKAATIDGEPAPSVDPPLSAAIAAPADPPPTAIDGAPRAPVEEQAPSPAIDGSTAATAATDPAPAQEQHLDPALGTGAIVLMLTITFAVAIGVFFLLPLFLASFIAGDVENDVVQHLLEGLIRVVIFIGYLALISLAPDIRRVFQYHGAEHMTIHALEAGDPLTVDEVRKYPTAHQRCGTEFLVVVILISIIAFSLVGRQEPLIMIGSRIVLIPVIAAIGYEILKFGARHRRNPIVKVIMYPGILVQMITTKRPTDDMIEVAIASMEEALVADGDTVPDGSHEPARSPMLIGGRPVISEPIRADVEPPAA